MDLGNGDFSLDVTDFGADDGLIVPFPSTTNIQVVFSTIPLSHAGVAVNVGDSVTIVGNNIDAYRTNVARIGRGGVHGVCAIIVEGKLYARIALHDTSFSVDDCFALQLPLFAYVEGENITPIGIGGGKAGWNLFPSLSRVRIAGYNLPTNLEYLAGGESPLSLTADGGDYGIEFTQPADAASVIVFDGGFWLYVGGL